MMTLEFKDMAIDLTDAASSGEISGYASRFGEADEGGDIVARGAYSESLRELVASGRRVKMLWQHNPAAPIGIWDEVREDETGLWVKGRLLDAVAQAREARALIEAGAIDGLSIGYRTISARKDEQGRRVLEKVELWEVSVVTFPMLPSARVEGKAGIPQEIVEKLKAGDRLSEREFERMAKGLGLSNSQAERAARLHLKGQGEPAAAADEAAQFWAALRGL